MKVIIAGFAFLAFCYLVFIIAGFIIPVDYEGEITKTFHCSKEKIWNYIIKIERRPIDYTENETLFMSGNDSIEQRKMVNYSEQSNFSVFSIIENKEFETYAISTVTEDGTRVGVWKYSLSGIGNYCKLTIRETSKISDNIARSFMIIKGKKSVLNKKMQTLIEVSNCE